MEMNPYLTFNGDCEAAFNRYAEVLKGKIEMMIPHEGTPAAEGVPASWQKKIIHARLTAGGKMLMGSDAPPEHYNKTQGMTVTITVEDPKEAERIFNGLAKGGTVQMPLQKTFFAQSFGTLTDQFNIPWMINCPPPM